jgi:simple sugar transport system substrate-binding protein
MITKRNCVGLMMALALLPSLGWAADMPKPFDEPDKVNIALVRYLSTGDFFDSYLSGFQAQAKALGVGLHIFDSQQDAALQSDMVDQAIDLGVDGIVIQHGLTESIKDAAQRAVDAGIKVVAFDVNIDNPKVPQIEQSDRDLARLVLEQALKDNGNSFVAGYVYVPGIAPLDRRNETWEAVKKANSGIKQVAEFGTFDNPIANSVANQTREVLSAHPNIAVMFAPYDEFAKGVKIAVDEANMSNKVSIYSADISTSDIQSMREADSAWKATAATNPALVGEVSVRVLAMLLAGHDPGHHVMVPPTLITQEMLNNLDIKNMADLVGKVPAFAHVAVAVPDWMPLPPR